MHRNNCLGCMYADGSMSQEPCDTCGDSRPYDRWTPAEVRGNCNTGKVATLSHDMVNHPPHYTKGGIECIEAIKAALTEEEFRGYCKGNALKYIWRERHKGGDESLKKAEWYLNKLTENGNV